MRLGVVLLLFLALIVAAVFIGGRGIIDPMLQKAMAQRVDLHRKGSIVFTMPDGAFCRHMAYDNKTAELIESAVAQCAEARPHDAGRAAPTRLCLGHALSRAARRAAALFPINGIRGVL